MKITKLLVVGVVIAGLSACGEKRGEGSSTVSNTTESAAVFVEQLKFPLKVKDVGLGLVRAPCAPSEETYVDVMQKPVRIQLECTVGSGSDSTDVVFAADGKSVVRVTRKQYLLPSDPAPGDVVKAAINFYGVPKEASDGNWLANYGDAFTITANGNAASASLNEAGTGLLVKGFLCADGSYGTVKCGNLGTSLIKYDLIDIAGYKQQIEDGKAKIIAKNQEKVGSQKF